MLQDQQLAVPGTGSSVGTTPACSVVFKIQLLCFVLFLPAPSDHYLGQKTHAWIAFLGEITF